MVGWHTFLHKLKPCTSRDLQTGAHTHPTPWGESESCLVPLPNSMPLSCGSPAASESKLALQPTDLVEFEAINYKGGGKRRLQFPVPLLPLEWVIRAWEGPTMSTLAWTSALSQKQPTERLVSNHHNHQSWNYPQLLHSGWHKSKA